MYFIYNISDDIRIITKDHTTLFWITPRTKARVMLKD